MKKPAFKDFKLDDNGLIPAIIQDADTRSVLMLGYMNEDSFEKSLETGLVTFFSRSKSRLWTKGESSGNVLNLVDWGIDCDQDALLILARPHGPTCHTGSDTCWGVKNEKVPTAFLTHLEKVIDGRYQDRSEKSYTASLFDKGTPKIAQKVGEEAVELVIEALSDNEDLFLGEAADLIYHFLVLLRDRQLKLEDVINTLKQRHK